MMLILLKVYSGNFVKFHFCQIAGKLIITISRQAALKNFLLSVEN